MIALNLSFNELHTLPAEDFIQVLNALPTGLKVLDLHQNDLNRYSASDLIRIFFGVIATTNITTINISDNNLNDNQLNALLKPLAQSKITELTVIPQKENRENKVLNKEILSNIDKILEDNRNKNSKLPSLAGKPFTLFQGAENSITHSYTVNQLTQL